MTSEAVERFVAPIAAKVMAAKVPEITPPKPVVEEAPAAPDLTAGAKLTQKIIESMDLRRQDRTRQIAALKSREVEVERENREAAKHANDSLLTLAEEYQRREATIKADLEHGTQARQADLRFKAAQIEKLDATLANFRKQLDAELLKLDPERGEGRERGEAK